MVLIRKLYCQIKHLFFGSLFLLFALACGGQTCTAPSQQALNIIGTPAFQSINVTWTNGDGSGRIVIINTINSFSPPVNGNSPIANPVYSGSGEQVVYNGSGNTVHVTGLQPCRDYWFMVFESNCTASAVIYNTSPSSGNPASASTGSNMTGTQTLINESFESTTVWPYTVNSVNVGTGGSMGNNVTEVRSLFGFNDSKGLVKSYSVSNSSGQSGTQAAIEFSEFDIVAGSTNVKLLLKVASLNEVGTADPSVAAGPQGRGNDTGENLMLQISRNGGPYLTTFTQRGYNNKLFDYSPQVNATLAWDANLTYVNSSIENNFTITFPAGTTQLQFKIITSNNRVEEAWCVDDIILIADVPPVNTLPLIYAITGGGAYCSGGPGVEIGLANSQTGISYQLFLNGTPLGDAIAGTGTAISFGNETLEGTYTVTATNIAYSNCQSEMSGPVTVSVTVPPVTSAIWHN